MPVNDPTQDGPSGRPGEPPPPHVPANRWFSSEYAMGSVASVLIGVVALMSWATTWSDWHSYRVLQAYQNGPLRDAERLDQADLISGLLGTVAALALLASASVFITWLWRVRWNAELFCRGAHRLGRGWVIGSWICPVVNLWYPKWIVDDVIAASDPRTPPHLSTLRGIPGTRLSSAWWLTWVVGLVLGNIAQRSVLDGAAEVGELLTNAVLSTISAAGTTAAAVLATLIVRRVNDLQTRRPWIPWWSAPQPPHNDGPPASCPSWGAK
jgi:uncharacterized protein DUF4328